MAKIIITSTQREIPFSNRIGAIVSIAIVDGKDSILLLVHDKVLGTHYMRHFTNDGAAIDFIKSRK